jgi:hypothetical protein
MHHRTGVSLVDQFRRVSPLYYAVLLRCVLQAGRPSLHCYCAVVLHCCIVLPPVSHFSNHEYHCCQLQDNSYVYTHSFCHGFGAYAPSLHAESVSVNAQPAETPGARSLSTCPACRSELSNSVETPRAAPKPIQIELYAPNLQV